MIDKPVKTPYPGPSPILGTGLQYDDLFQRGGREVKGVTKPPAGVPTVSDRKTALPATTAPALPASVLPATPAKPTAVKVPTIPGTTRQPSWTTVKPGDKGKQPQKSTPPAPTAVPTKSKEVQEAEQRVKDLQAEREFFLTGHGKDFINRDSELQRLNTEIVGLQTFAAKSLATEKAAKEELQVATKTPAASGSPVAAAKPGGTKGGASQTPAPAAAPTPAPPGEPAAPGVTTPPATPLTQTPALGTRNAQGEYGWRVLSAGEHQKIVREINQKLNELNKLPASFMHTEYQLLNDSLVLDSNLSKTLGSEIAYIRNFINKTDNDIIGCNRNLELMKNYLKIVLAEQAEFLAWSNRVNSGGGQNWTPWTKGTGFKVGQQWVWYGANHLAEVVAAFQQTIRDYEIRIAKLMPLNDFLKAQLTVLEAQFKLAPTLFTADGRPLWGAGTQNDPYREYPDLTNPPGKLVGKGSKDDPLRPAPVAEIAVAQTPEGKKIWGKGTKDDPYRDYPDLNNPPFKTIGSGTKDDPLREAPPEPKIDQAKALTPGATYDGKTYKDGQKIIGDNGVEYTAKGGKWEPGRQLAVGEVYIDSKGDMRMWTGANGMLLEDWQKQEKVNSIYGALTEIDRLRNIQREGATDKALDQLLSDRKQSDKLLADLRDLQKHVFDRKEFADAWASGEAAKVYRTLDDLASQLNRTGTVDQAQLDQFKRVYTGLLTGSLVTKDQQEALLQMGGYREIAREWFAGMSREVFTQTYQTPEGETKVSWAGAGARLIAAFLTVGESEVVFLTAKGAYGVYDYGSKEGGDSALEGFRRVGSDVAKEGFILLGLETAMPYALQYSGRVLEATINTAIRSGEIVAPQLTETIVLRGLQLADDVSRGAKSFWEVLNTEVQIQLPEVFRPLLEQGGGSAVKSYGQYLLEAQARATAIVKAAQKGELSMEQVLEAQADPATMRALKKYVATGTKTAKDVGTKLNQALNTATGQADDAVKQAMEARYNGQPVKVETVRTPSKEGYKSWDLNTDRDIRALVQGKDGVWREIPKSEWEGVYNRKFAEATGITKDGKFDLEAAKQRFKDVNWDKMSETQRINKWAELHNQEPADVFQRAGARDFSDQPTAIKPGGKPAPGETSYTKATEGTGTLQDPEQLALMTQDKVRDYWYKGVSAKSPAEALKYQTEALEQLSKQTKMAEQLNAGYAKTFRVKGLDPQIEKGIKIINTRALSPELRQQQLIELGFTGGVMEFSEKLASNIHSLRIALPL
jgi:hypothetical protein